MTFAFPVQFLRSRDMHGALNLENLHYFGGMLTHLVSPASAVENTRILPSRCRKYHWRLKNSKHFPGVMIIPPDLTNVHEK